MHAPAVSLPEKSALKKPLPVGVGPGSLVSGRDPTFPRQFPLWRVKVGFSWECQDIRRLSDAGTPAQAA